MTWSQPTLLRLTIRKTEQGTSPKLLRQPQEGVPENSNQVNRLSAGSSCLPAFCVVESGSQCAWFDSCAQGQRGLPA